MFQTRTQGCFYHGLRFFNNDCNSNISFPNVKYIKGKNTSLEDLLPFKTQMEINMSAIYMNVPSTFKLYCKLDHSDVWIRQSVNLGFKSSKGFDFSKKTAFPH